MPRRTHSLALLAAVFVGVLHLILFGVYFWPYSSSGYSDFAIFYTAGKIVNEGNAPQLYDPSVQWAVQRSLNVPIREGPLLFNHAPFEALLFVPLSRLPFQAGFAIWSLVNIGLLAAIGFTVRKYVGDFLPHWSAPAVIGMAGFPCLMTLVQGQDSFILALIYAFVFAGLKERKDLLAGMCLALGTFKPQLVLPFLGIMLIRKQWKFVGGFAIGAGFVTAVSAAMMGVPGLLGYVRFLADFARMPYEISAAPPGNMPNIRGLLLTLVPWLGRTTGFVMIATASSVLVVVAARVWKEDLETGFVLAATVTLLCSYHLYPYDVSLLLAPMLVLLARIHKRPFTSKWRGNTVKIAGATWCISGLAFTAMANLKASLFALVLIATAAALVIELATSRKMTYEPVAAAR
jgi:hypothetical protein